MPKGWKAAEETSLKQDSDKNEGILCHHCNKRSRTSSLFCNYCGTKFDDIIQTEPELIDGFQIYEISDRLTIQYPSDWMTMDRISNPGLDASIRVGFGPRTTIASSSPTFLAVSSAQVPILPALISQSSEQSVLATNVELSEEDPSHHLMESSSFNLAGRIAHKVVVEFDDRSNKYLKIFTISGDEIWIFAFQTSVQLFPVYLPTVEKIISSIQFRPFEQISNPLPLDNSKNVTIGPSIITTKNINDARNYSDPINLSFADIEPQERLEKSEELLEMDPNNALAWNAKGTACEELGRTDAALQSFDKAISIDPHCYLAWANKGGILNSLNRDDEGVQCYGKALEYSQHAIMINPHDVVAWKTKANVLCDLRRYDNAVECYDKAISLLPNDNASWTNKGYALNELEEYQEALKCFNKAIELTPTDVEAWSNKGKVLSDLKLFKESLESYSKVIELRPDDPIGWYGEGANLVELGGYEEALKCFDKALALNPEDTDVWYNKTCTEIKIGRIDVGLSHFEKLVKLGGKKYVHFAEQDEFFDSVRNDERFKKLID